MFVCTVQEDAELPLAFLEGNGEFIARVPVGFHTETGCVFSVFLAMAPLAGHADIPGFEFIFSIIEAKPDGSAAREFWDGLATRDIIVDALDRRKICGVIAMIIPMLIDAAKPNLISMTTHTPNLPDSALAKFNRICTIFANNGYRAGRTDSYHGRHIWMMDR